MAIEDIKEKIISDAHNNAQQIIQNAQNKAEEIIEKAKKEAENIKQKILNQIKKEIAVSREKIITEAKRDKNELNDFEQSIWKIDCDSLIDFFVPLNIIPYDNIIAPTIKII